MKIRVQFVNSMWDEEESVDFEMEGRYPEDFDDNDINEKCEEIAEQHYASEWEWIEVGRY